MKNIITLLLSAFFVSVTGQVNLVTNGGFEQYSSCPNFGAQWQLCNGWNNVNMNTGVGPWGTPDYLNVCGTGATAPPNTFAGTCSPHSGNAMMALVLYNVPYTNYREYLCTQLNCNMTPGNTYTLSFWLSNGTNVLSPWTIKNIGVHFSNAPLSQSGWGLISAIPQCEITTNVVSSGWTQYSFTVNPTATWNYLTIGAFRADGLNNPTMAFPNPGGNPSVYANYFVDDIEVLSSNQGLGAINFSSSSGQFGICSGQSLTLTATGANSYTWNNNSASSSIVVSPTVTSNYSVNGIGGCTGTLSLNSAITVTVYPNPILSISGNTTICPGQSATLTASGAGTYSWSNGFNSGTVVLSPTATSVYTVSGSDPNTNCSASTSHTLFVHPKPVISISGNTAICAGQTASLVASGASSYWWNLSLPGGFLNVTPLVSTSYSVVGTDLNGCQSSTFVNVVVSSSLSLQVSGNTNLCHGNTAILTASGASTYSWNNVAGGAVFTVSPNSTTIYTLSGIDNQSKCSGKTTVTVSVKECLGVNELKQTTVWTVYPNPFSEKLIMKYNDLGTEHLSVGLYNALGELVYQNEKLPATAEFEINTGNLPTGIYFIKVSEGKNTQVLKIIKH